MLHSIEMGCNGRPPHYIRFSLFADVCVWAMSNEHFNVGICHWFIKDDDQSPSNTVRVTAEKNVKISSSKMRKKTRSDKKEDMRWKGAYEKWIISISTWYVMSTSIAHTTHRLTVYFCPFSTNTLFSLQLRLACARDILPNCVGKCVCVAYVCMQWAVAPKKHFCHRSFSHIPKINSGTHTRT